MEHYAQQNSTRGFYVFADDSAAFGTGKTGLTLTITLSKSGAAANSVSPTQSEIGNGWYWIAPSSSHRDTLGRNLWQFSATGALIAGRVEKIGLVDEEATAFGAAVAGDAMALTSSERNSVADAILVRDVSNVEGTANDHSLCYVVLAMSEHSISGTTLTVKKTDGSTTFATKTLGTATSADSITSIT